MRRLLPIATVHKPIQSDVNIEKIRPCPEPLPCHREILHT